MYACDLRVTYILNFNINFLATQGVNNIRLREKQNEDYV